MAAQKSRPARLWNVLILLAPIAGLLGLYFTWRYERYSHLGLTVSRADVVRTVRQLATSKNVDTTGWPALVDLYADNRIAHYLAALEPAERATLQRIIPPIVFRCVLENPDRVSDSVRATVSPGGRIDAFSVPPAATSKTVSMAEAEAMATAALRQRLGAAAAHFERMPGSVERHESTGAEVRHWRWQRTLGPDIRLNAIVKVAGGTVVGVDVTFDAETYVRKHSELHPPVVRGAATAVVILSMLVYVIYRLIRRLREQEVPLRRTAVVMLVVLVAFVSTTLLTLESRGIENVNTGTEVPAGLDYFVFAIMALVMSAALAVAWGGSEADVREAYPEKLTSMDAILGGAFRAPALRTSLASAATVGAYLVFFSGIEAFLRTTGGVWSSISAGELLVFQSQWPALMTVVAMLGSQPMMVAGVMVAASMAHRPASGTPARLLLIAIIGGIAGLTVLGSFEPAAHGALAAILRTAMLLIPFFVVDLLAVFVSNLLAALMIGAAGLIAQPSAFYQNAGWTVLAVVAALLAAGIVATFRRGSPAAVLEDARPEYARNIAQRQMLAAELDTARQAQLRVLPRTLPQIDGMSVAATSMGGVEVGSHYYEVFPRAQHVGIAVADTRLAGLSSALCVSMLKGLLLNYTTRFDDPGEIVRRVHRQLTGVFGDELPLSMTYATLDREGGSIRYATFGSAPRLVHVGAGGAVAHETTNAKGTVRIDGSEAVVFYTAGLPGTANDEGTPLGDEPLLAELSRATERDAEQLVDLLRRVATRHARGVETDREWTALVLTAAPRERADA